MRNISLILVILIAFTIISFGCDSCPSGKDRDTRILAKINNYKLTVEDFKEEGMSDPFRGKEELLESVIIKKILLQEAQKQNFDKDRAFMQEIKRYWEQALLKLLIKKKTEDISRELTAKGGEADEEAVRKGLQKWTADLKEKSLIKINDEILREIK